MKDVIVCERDYWVYQRRRVFLPWAIRMTKRYEKGKRRTLFVEFDFTIKRGQRTAFRRDIERAHGLGLKVSIGETLAR